MKIICIDFSIENVLRKHKRGDVSSQQFYGCYELEKKGFDVYYYSLSTKGIKGIIKDIINLKKIKADVLFFPYLREKFYIFLTIAKKIGYLRHEKLIGVLHFTPTSENKSSKFYARHIYKVFDKVFFHSPKNMEECIKQGFVKRSQAEIIHWGTDLKYIDSIQYNETDNGNFVSTGLECRDFQTLIDSFSLVPPKIKLDIYLYSQFPIKNSDTENVKIHYIHKDNTTQYYTAQKAKASRAVVIPINDHGLTYCTGHTSIVEAMALGKPIIVTDNPYHPIDVEKERIGIKVKPNDPESWKQAILYAASHKKEMEEMGLRGRELAETTYNIDVCSKQLYTCIMSLFTHK